MSRKGWLNNNDLKLGMSSWKKHVAQSWALLRPKGNESSKNEKWSKLGKCGAGLRDLNKGQWVLSEASGKEGFHTADRD